jgi:hypothetical protein
MTHRKVKGSVVKKKGDGHYYQILVYYYRPFFALQVQM